MDDFNAATKLPMGLHKTIDVSIESMTENLSSIGSADTFENSFDISDKNESLVVSNTSTVGFSAKYIEKYFI